MELHRIALILQIMRLLTEAEIKAQLNRGKTVEAFLGNCSDVPEVIGWIELYRTADDDYTLTKFLVEDIGDPDFLDIYAFPEAEEPQRWTFKTLEETTLFAAAEFPDAGFVNAGMVQYVYDVFLKNEKQ